MCTLKDMRAQHHSWEHTNTKARSHGISEHWEQGKTLQLSEEEQVTYTGLGIRMASD